MAMSPYEGPGLSLMLEEQDGALIRVYFSGDSLPRTETYWKTPVLQEAARQLDAYFAGELRAFSLPLSPAGTDFQRYIWKLLCEIPYGKTATYGQLALKAGRPRAARAIGLCNNKNPIPIFIPCHRVVGADGSLTGYRGGLALKERLLRLEAEHS